MELMTILLLAITCNIAQVFLRRQAEARRGGTVLLALNVTAAVLVFGSSDKPGQSLGQIIFPLILGLTMATFYFLIQLRKGGIS